MKALVIGDPDDTLKWARDEANKVKDILGRVMEVELRIGSSDGLEGLGRYRGIRPADLYDVVALLQSGEYDIVHYCGTPSSLRNSRSAAAGSSRMAC
jgi:hypothetical protein